MPFQSLKTYPPASCRDPAIFAWPLPLHPIRTLSLTDSHRPAANAFDRTPALCPVFCLSGKPRQIRQKNPASG